jgi:hypothetical protein
VEALRYSFIELCEQGCMNPEGVSCLAQQRKERESAGALPLRFSSCYYTKKTRALRKEPGFLKVGDDLLFHKCSTIGADGLNFSVRNGKRWFPVAIVT